MPTPDNPVLSSEETPAIRSPRCRVFLADDHGVVRAAFRCLLEATGAATVVGEAADGEEAVTQIGVLKPDVAIVDVGMPKQDGVTVTRTVGFVSPATKVLIVSGSEDAETIRSGLRAGAAGFLPKSAAGEDLLTAIRVVAKGGTYVHNSVLESLLRAHLQPPEISSLLSEKETQVLKGIALGHSNKEIASTYAVGVKTVETYKARAMRKLGVTSRAEIIRYAYLKGWLAEQLSKPPPTPAPPSR